MNWISDKTHITCQIFICTDHNSKILRHSLYLKIILIYCTNLRPDVCKAHVMYSLFLLSSEKKSHNDKYIGLACMLTMYYRNVNRCRHTRIFNVIINCDI